MFNNTVNNIHTNSGHYEISLKNRHKKEDFVNSPLTFLKSYVSKKTRGEKTVFKLHTSFD